MAAAETKIKSEYLIRDHVRTLSLKYITEADKQKLSHARDSDGTCAESGRDESGQPARKKLKGQNKRRGNPYNATQVPRTEKLCPRVARGDDCPYKETCDYVHDVSIFLANKQKDLSDRCHLFDTFGQCSYGASCRFSSAHCIKDTNEEHNGDPSSIDPRSTTRNYLSKELQALLRKRQYDFKKANHVVDALKQFMRLKSERRKEESSNDQVDLNLTNTLSLKQDTTEVRHFCQDIRCLLSHEQRPDKSDAGATTDEDVIRTRSIETKRLDFSGKLYLAPLTTVGNLPFRRICKTYGADITCGEMAMAQNLLQGQQSEWALLKRHVSEDCFGVQICGAHADQMTRCAQMLCDNIDVDFIDINVGCPIELVNRRGAGCALMDRLRKFEEIVYGMKAVMNMPLTAKIRTGVHERKSTAHTILPKLRDYGVDMVTMHGRSREQRYTKSADWDYIDQCAKVAVPMPFFGCGDILSYEEVDQHLKTTSVAGVMIARGALVKPWIFTEIKERKHLDVTSHERMEMLKDFVRFGFEHWGSDTEGVEKTRKFLLEWLSFLYRYIPVGLLESIPQKINERPPYYRGRDDLETLMASACCGDWIKLSEMLLGPVPPDFSFLPKHKANSYT